MLLRVLAIAVSATLLHAADPGPDDLLALVVRSAAPARFASHRPVFSIDSVPMTHATPKGPSASTWWVLRDGGRIVGFLREGDRVWDFATYTPGMGPTAVPDAPRYHNVTQLDTRMTLAYGQRPERWAEPKLTTAVEGERAVFRSRSVAADGKQELSWDLVIRVDPVLGYVGEVGFSDRRRERPRHGQVEFINHYTRGLPDLWPGRATFDRTVASLAMREGLTGWWNNLAAIELSDNLPNRGMRTGGFIAWLGGAGIGGDGTGRAMSWLSGEHAFDTCNCWADHHNHVRFPEKSDADGWFVAAPRFRLSAVPPETVAMAIAEAAWQDFGTAVFVRVGVREDFSGQPFSSQSPVRGMYRRHSDWRIEATAGRGGSPALRIQAVEQETGMTGFIDNPQLNLLPNRTLVFRVRVKPEGTIRRLLLSGHTYEWTPHLADRISRQRSAIIGSEAAPPESGQPAAVVEADGWTTLEVRVTAPAYDVFVDPRIVVIGDKGASVLVDDLEILEVTKDG